jgi:hypothetical protein
MLLLAVIFAIVLLVSSPYLLIVHKRAKMLKRITAQARRYGFRTRKLHALVCFALNRAPRYDLLFEAKEIAYAVKLWSSTKKGSTLFIRGDGTVCESVKARSVMDTEHSGERTVRTRAKKVAPTQNNFKVRRGKPVVSVMLYYPTAEKVILNLGSTSKRLTSGDRALDKILCTPAHFEKMLSENVNTQSKAVTEKPQ